MTLKVVRQFQGRRIESRTIATARQPWISKPIAQRARTTPHHVPTMQQNDCRVLLPVLFATVKPSVNNVVFGETAWSRRRKAKLHPRLVEAELYSRRVAFVANEVWPVQKLNRLVQPESLPVKGWSSPAAFLDEKPVDQFGQGCNHAFTMWN